MTPTMLWLPISLVAYFLFALAALGDKALLSGPLKSPAVYAAFVGIGGLLPILLTPFLGFPIPDFPALILAQASGVLYALALLPFYAGIRRYEVSRIVPATGGLVPLFMYVFGLAAFPGENSVSAWALFAFLLLVCGSVLLSRDGGRLSLGSFAYSLPASFLFASSFLLLKFAYLLQPFWSGFLWTQIGAGAMGISLLLGPKVRSAVWARLMGSGRHSGKGTTLVFFGAQGSAAAAGILQHLALFLVPAAYYAFVNALQGTQYLFLLVMAAAFSARYPRIFGERNAGRALAAKSFGTLLVVAGVAMLVLTAPRP
jgi:hypothetical protein